MSLDSLIQVVEKREKQDAVVVSEEVLRKNVDKLRQLIMYWRMYPDKFVDYLCSLNPKNTFKFYSYQRIFLRAVMRHKYVYMVFPRAYSKSFLCTMAYMLRAVLYPGAKLFMVSGVKEQSAAILSSKFTEICTLIPALANEVEWETRGSANKTQQTKDKVVFTFKNGSFLQNVPATQSSRGLRFHSGIMEECVGIDQDILHEVLIPTMNIDRMVNGKTDDNEVLNKSQCFVTTAGYKNMPSYAKLIQFLCQMVAKPKESIILGGTWRIPVLEGLQSLNFVNDLKADGTFNEAAFEREYESNWGGVVEDAFFDPARFDEHRVLNMAEIKYNNKLTAKDYYVIGVDVGRIACTTEAVVIKVTHPDPRGAAVKQIVNIFTFEEEHFGLQSIKLKRLFNQFNCKCMVVDGNGLGVGLIDFLTMDQLDPDTDETLCNFGVYNDEDGLYKKFQNENTIHNALYVMKANQTINSECYSYVQSQLFNGKLRFLIDETVAKNKLQAMEKGKKMTPLQRAEYLMPYTQTSILKDQMMNLMQNQEGAMIILKRANQKIGQDKFSALIYGLFYCKLMEDRSRKRKGPDLSKMMLFTKSGK